MANEKVNWIKIKNEYINTDISQRKLAEKHEISFNTLKDKANKEHWSSEKKKQHNKITTKTQQKTAEIIIEAEVDRVANIIRICDKLSQKVEEAIEQLDVIRVGEELVKTGIVDTDRLRKLVQNTKDLRDIIKEDADTIEVEDLSEVEGEIFD